MQIDHKETKSQPKKSQQHYEEQDRREPQLQRD